MAFTDIKNIGSAVGIDNIDTINALARTLSPISSNAMNKLQMSPSHDHPTPSKTPNGTIRSVPAESLHIDTSDDNLRVQSRSDPSPVPQSTKTFSPLPTSQSSLQITKNTLPVGNGMVRTISAEFGPTRTYNNVQPSEELNGSNGISPGSSQWSSAVGRANLGKSGRVIERLMAENDMLKRDLNIERLRAEESKQAVKLAEGRMEALSGEYEGRLHDAAVTKTLLKRRERQLADLKAQIDGEKARADAAIERERGWREVMEQTEEESKVKVEEAQTYAALMEGRNKTMANHWKEQGAEVSKTVGKLGKEIESLVLERRGDDERMNMLQGLCDQQAGQLDELVKQKLEIAAHFEAYKREQEDALRAIKERAVEQERANELALEETQRVLGELKWALGVKRNVKGAQ
jgi:hypothetical protein